MGKALKAVDKTIVMGAAMDGNALKAGAEAHHKAIGSIDGSGVTSASDYEAVNNAWAGILSPSVPNKLFSGVNPLDANAAAKAFYEFKDVVKAASAKRILTARSRFIYEMSRMFG